MQTSLSLIESPLWSSVFQFSLMGFETGITGAEYGWFHHFQNSVIYLIKVTRSSEG